MQLKTDFPYYSGQPVEIGLLGWLAILASVVAAFLLLTHLPFAAFPLYLIQPIVFTGLPLLTLALVSGGHHTALFGRVGIKQVLMALGFGVLTLVVSMAVGLLLMQVTTMTANTAASGLADYSTFDTVMFLVRTAIQLVGEEVMTMLPLLAVLWFCVRKLNLSRRTGLIVAVIVSTLWFAAVHLPTYNWNFIQCFGGIGAARLVLTAAFLLTRNLWVSAGAHIVNDWTEFFLPVVLAGAAGHVPIDTAG